MTEINQLSATDSVLAGDLLPVFKSNQGSARKLSITTLMEYIDANVTQIVPITQYAAPAATGFSITIASGDIWLIITPISTFAAGTLVLPTNADDKDTVTVICTQVVTALTVSSGASVIGAPTTLAANDFFTMKFDAVTSAWYRVG